MSTRQTADARREALVRAAHRHFAHGGLHGTAVSAITDDVGITQPYAFRLFRTKKELFLAACGHNADRVVETFRAAADGLPPEERLAAMGAAYVELLQDREVLLRARPRDGPRAHGRRRRDARGLHRDGDAPQPGRGDRRAGVGRAPRAARLLTRVTRPPRALCGARERA